MNHIISKQIILDNLDRNVAIFEQHIKGSFPKDLAKKYSLPLNTIYIILRAERYRRGIYGKLPHTYDPLVNHGGIHAKKERNKAIYKDAKSLTTKQLSEKYKISQHRILQIITRQLQLEELQRRQHDR